MSRPPHLPTKLNTKSLHLFWEFPPFIQGGLAVAGKALCNALSNYMEIDIAYPSSNQQHSDTSSNCHTYPIHITEDSICTSNDGYLQSTQHFQQFARQQIERFTSGVKAAHFTNYQSIHAHDWITMDAARAVQKSHPEKHIPIILHIHSTQVDRIGPHAKDIIFQKEHQAMLDADHIIAVSTYTRNCIIKYYNIPESKITIVRNAHTPNPVHPQEGQKSTKPHEPTILFAARLESQKSPLFALEVICQVLQKLPHAKAIIAGKGSFLEPMRKIIKFKKLNSRISILGHIPHDKMQLVYQESEVLILPSASEPFGLVAVEAALADTAVIASPYCGVNETLTAVPQLPLNSPLALTQWVQTTSNLLTDSTLRNQQITAQKQQLENYSWDQAAQKILSIIHPDHD